MSVIDIKPDAQGKVRDLYDLGDKLLLVASDRISAFDYILEDEIPYKGQVLTQLSCFWFDLLSDVVDNHLISADVADLPEQFKPYADKLAGRFMLVKKANMYSVECIVRGYLTGSGLKDYQKTGAVCGIQLPEGLVNSSKLTETIFTPSTKAEIGDHDENISFERCEKIIGDEAAAMRDAAIKVYNGRARPRSRPRHHHRRHQVRVRTCRRPLILGDEVLTPDSSRFWPADAYEAGEKPVELRQAVCAQLAQCQLGPHWPTRRVCPKISSRRPAKSTFRLTRRSRARCSRSHREPLRSVPTGGHSRPSALS